MTELNEWIIFFHLIIGTLVSCAGACTLNQAIEYDSDSKMNRTANRSIPKGHISPLKAFIFGFLLSVSGILYLFILLNEHELLLTKLSFTS